MDLRELLARGNGMEEKFGEDDPGAPDVASLLSRHWDYVVMNDYTQAPARAASRRASIDVLVHQIAPMLRRCGGTPVLLETWAYLFPSKGSDDLGDHAEFTARLCSSSVSSHSPVAAFHTRTVLSWLADTIFAPSGLKHAERTPPL